MSLTAREWLLLPKEEQERRKSELSKEECAKLRLELSMAYFTEDEKRDMPEEKREEFLHPREYTDQEKEDFNQKCRDIFKQMQEEAKAEREIPV